MDPFRQREAEYGIILLCDSRDIRNEIFDSEVHIIWEGSLVFQLRFSSCGAIGDFLEVFGNVHPINCFVD
jgi:hypothetical protein